MELVVSAGPDLGARLALSEGEQVVGRGRDAQLRLTDLAVSRRHLQVVGDGDCALIRVVAGASPFTMSGKKMVDARMALGDKIVIGNTALALVRPRVAVESTETREVTDVRSLLGEMAVDARGLSAIFELSERLDAVADVAGIEQAVASWAKTFVRSSDVQLLPEANVAEDQMVECASADGGTVEVTVPLVGAAPSALAFRIPLRKGRLSPELRRLLAVTGRVVASASARIRALGRASDEVRAMRRLALGSATSFLGSSPAAEQVTKLVGKLARSNATALIVGETGVGKSFLARLIHEASPRASEPLRIINCAAIPDNLVESELFGHKKGAFTGADSDRQGALEAAGAGTVLLDEIGDLPLASQAKLLHVLEAKQFEPVGSNRTTPLLARVLAATNKDLKQLASDGGFRSDLYFRISVISVAVPPLRERQGDIVILAERFLSDMAPSCGRHVTGISPAALSVMSSYAWPGNVRELRNVIEHALVLGEHELIEPSDLPLDLRGQAVEQPQELDVVRLPLDLATLEAKAIEAALRATSGNRTKAAALLGINRVTLYKKLK